MELVLGNKNFSSWSLRPWLALRQAGIPFEERVMLFETPGWRDEILKYSPTRKVPALRDGDLVVVESLAICEYVAEKFPAAGLWPDDIAARAVARSVATEMHAGFGAMRGALYMDIAARHTKDVLTPETKADVERVQTIWEECRTKFGAGGPFLFGRFSIADAMFAPVVFRFLTWNIPVTKPAAKAWYETMLALPAMKEWEAAGLKEMESRTAVDPSRTPDVKSAQHQYAVIFTSQHSTKLEGYDELSDRMAELAAKQRGFLGIESARNAAGFGITVSYWASLEDIARCKAVAEHRAAQARGNTQFYDRYSVRVCSVERSYGKGLKSGSS